MKTAVTWINILWLLGVSLFGIAGYDIHPASLIILASLSVLNLYMTSSRNKKDPSST